MSDAIGYAELSRQHGEYCERRLEVLGRLRSGLKGVVGKFERNWQVWCSQDQTEIFVGTDEKDEEFGGNSSRFEIRISLDLDEGSVWVHFADGVAAWAFAPYPMLMTEHVKKVMSEMDEVVSYLRGLGLQVKGAHPLGQGYKEVPGVDEE